MNRRHVPNRPSTRRRHLRAVPDLPSIGQTVEQQELFQQLRVALRQDEPLSLMLLVSSMVEACDPRSSMFAPGAEIPSIEHLVASFLEPRYAETTAVLTLLREFIEDAELVAAIDAELAGRPHPLPRWLSRLDEAVPGEHPWKLAHELGDSTEYLFQIDFAGARVLTTFVHVDHIAGSAVTTAMFAPVSADDALEVIRPGLPPSLRHIGAVPEDLRVAVAAGLELGRMLYPPPEGESWPMGRPLLEWMLRRIPEGGQTEEPYRWTDRDKNTIAENFFASEFGRDLDDPGHRDLLDILLVFGCDFGLGDPYRWSSARIKMLLLEQVPHQVVGADDDLVRLPELLRAFVRWAHSGGGIDPSLTEESLATISQCEPDYLGLIGRHTTGGTDGRYQAWLAEQSRYYRQVLEESVGGAEQLARLDDRPLPDEPFDLDGIPADITAVVEQVREHCDRCADEVFDVEHRTAMRRFLHRAAVGQPAIFRRKASTVRAAAAIAWAIGRANETVGSYRCITAKDLQARFGLSGSAAQRALPMLRAIGASDQTYGFVALRTPDLLVSTRRAQLIRERDDLD